MCVCVRVFVIGWVGDFSQGVGFLVGYVFSVAVVVMVVMVVCVCVCVCVRACACAYM